MIDHLNHLLIQWLEYISEVRMMNRAGKEGILETLKQGKWKVARVDDIIETRNDE